MAVLAWQSGSAAREDAKAMTKGQAMDLVRRFLETKEAKESAWIAASRAIIENRKMTQSDDDAFRWGPWRVDPNKKTVRLYEGDWDLHGKITIDESGYRITDIQIIRIIGRR